MTQYDFLCVFLRCVYMEFYGIWYYNHIAKYHSKGMKIVKKKLFGIIDLKPKLRCEQAVIVEYYMTEKEDDDENYDVKKLYGIEVVKKQKIDGVIYREIKSVDNISCDPQQINDLLAILHRNSVTPITVGDVLEDLAVK